MERKDQIALALLFAGACGGILITSLSQRIRDLFFFLMVTLSAVTEMIDVNFVSKEWYRGTTCGFEVSLVDVISLSVLASSIIRPRSGEKRLFWPASLGLMIIYFLFASFCVGMADPKIFGLFELSKMLRGLVMFLAAAIYLRSERELRLFILALGTIVCLEGITAIGQRYLAGTHRVYGTIDDSNSLSMYLCTTAPVFVAVITSRFPKYLKLLGAAAIGLAFIGVILTISRAGLIAMLAMLFCAAIATASYKITLRKTAITLLVALAMAGILAKAWKTVGARFADDSLKNEYSAKHVQNRGYYIRIAMAIAKDSWFGVGPNNWSYWVSNKYGPRLGWYFLPYPGTDEWPKQKVPPGRDIDDPQAAPAHSLAALTVGEMGFGGLALLTLLWLRWLLMGASFLWPRSPDPMRRIGVGIFFGMCGTFFQSLTEWVFHQTPIFFTFNILVGVLASLIYVRKCERRARREAQRELEEREEQALWPTPVSAENF
jgi:O-antigen ligase/polysaccharide polymerase Wzy-like membrane protein